MNTYTFKTNINCDNCIKSVTPSLNAVPEIENWKVDTEHADKLLTVELEDGEEPGLVLEAVQGAGFSISLLALKK